LGVVKLADNTYRESHSFGSFSAVPSILHACKEAREVGLRHYSLEFGREVLTGNLDLAIGAAKRWPKLTIPPKIYINWAVDIICPISHCSVHCNCDAGIPMNRMLNVISTKISTIRRLALDIQYFDAWGEELLQNLLLTQLVLYRMRNNSERCTLSTKYSTGVELVEPVDREKEWEYRLLTYIDEGDWGHRSEISLKDLVMRKISNIQSKAGEDGVPAGWKAPSVEPKRLGIGQLSVEDGDDAEA
jgi:hypothetical protein